MKNVASDAKRFEHVAAAANTRETRAALFAALDLGPAREQLEQLAQALLDPTSNQ